METDNNFGELTADDLGKLRSIVKRKSGSTLTREDREDIVSRILEGAVNASLKTGVSVKVAMFSLAAYPSYYTRMADEVMDDVRNRTMYEQKLVGHDSEGSPSYAPEPAEQIDFTDSLAAQDLIVNLPVIEREVLIAHDLNHDTLVEIAADSGVPRTTVHRRLLAARAHMREYWLTS